VFLFRVLCNYYRGGDERSINISYYILGVLIKSCLRLVSIDKNSRLPPTLGSYWVNQVYNHTLFMTMSCAYFFTISLTCVNLSAVVVSFHHSTCLLDLSVRIIWSLFHHWTYQCLLLSCSSALCSCYSYIVVINRHSLLLAVSQIASTYPYQRAYFNRKCMSWASDTEVAVSKYAVRMTFQYEYPCEFHLQYRNTKCEITDSHKPWHYR
jgi:hypothetical protein